jgi:DNA mismatch repair protein MutL
MPPVRLLDPSVIGKIRAGEVVDRPAAVAKELIENALDAGSRLIAIQSASNPDRMIRVQDDGSGMGREDALLAVRRHATSKLERAEDLEAIATLGFRGEALASIAEVSRLTLSTRAADELTGTQIEILGGTTISVSGVGRAVGTTVSVEDLFFNTPARKRFLRSREAEVRALARVVWSYALVAPHVHWRFRVDGREDTELPTAADLLERWQVFYGRGSAESAAPFEHEGAGYRFRGVLGAPEMARANREQQIFAVNGRVIASSSMAAAVRQGFGNLIPGDRHPVALLLVDIDPSQIDVNVHPTKREVRFRDESGLFQATRRAVENAMRVYVPVALGVPESGSRVPEEGSAGGTLVIEPGTVEEGSPPYVPQGVMPERLFESAASADLGSPWARERVVTADVKESLAEVEVPIWQLHDRYLLAPIRGGLVIVDQHAAHERVLYEVARIHLADEAGPSQHLLFPRVLDLSPPELEELLSMEPLVRRLGYEVSLFGERQVAIRGVPAALAEETAIDALKRLLAGEETHGEIARDDPPEERIAKSWACHAAVRSGQPLDPVERRALFDRLFATTLPHGDPHGRPTYVRVPLEELDRRFGRR